MHTMNRSSFERLVQEDIDWLESTTTDTLERRHILEILKKITSLEYDEHPRRALTHFVTENGERDESKESLIARRKENVVQWARQFLANDELMTTENARNDLRRSIGNLDKTLQEES